MMKPSKETGWSKFYSSKQGHEKPIVATTGYNANKRWKNLYLKVPEHERSNGHKNHVKNGKIKLFYNV